MKLLKLVFLTTVVCLATGAKAQIAMTDTKVPKRSNVTDKESKKTAPPKVLKEEETVFVDSDNKIYVNKNLPIYLKFSTTPDGETHDLKSLSHPEDTEPLYLDTEGANFIRTKWAVDPETKEYAYPLREIQMELYADSKAPIVQPVFDVTHVFKRDGVTYYGKDLQIAFREWDEQSGVKNTLWSLNNEAWTSGKSSFENNNTDQYSFAYYSVDNVNNYSETKSVSFVYDKTAPKTTLQKPELSTYVFGPTTPMQFDVVEQHSGVQATYFKLGNNSYIKVKPNQVMPDLSDGEYEITFYSVDNVVNGEELKVEQVYLDKIAPVTSLKATSSYLDGLRLYVSPNSAISLTSY